VRAAIESVPLPGARSSRVSNSGRSPCCIEPHNVKALGSACPFSHQCLGCVHFRTDPSYLPDLYAYLEQLLDARERLNAAVPQLRDWAREKGGTETMRRSSRCAT
jgi:hypothetical protein